MGEHVLSSAIRFAREKRGMTQTEFARTIGIKTQATISELESGKAPITEKSLERVATGLGLTVRGLLRAWLEGTCDECGKTLDTHAGCQPCRAATQETTP